MLIRRGKIRTPRRGTDVSPHDLEPDISTICSCVRELLSYQTSKHSFEELFRSSYKIGLRKKNNILYERVHDVLQEWLSQEVKPDIIRLASACDETRAQSNIDCSISTETRLAGQNFLVELNRIWGRYDRSIWLLSDIFLYMDRENNERPSISSSFKARFRHCILQAQLDSQRKRDTTVQEVLRDFILKQIELERNGDIIDRRLIKSCVDILLDISKSADEAEGIRFYITALESDFLQASREFYRAERSVWLRESTAGPYVRHVKRRVLEEQNRSRSIFPESTVIRVQNVLKEELAPIHG